MIRAALATLTFVFGLTAFAQTPKLPSPIEQASAGKLQCYSPNREKKTCQSMAAYRTTAKGGIENPASVLLNPNPLIVMNTVSPVTVREGKVCGPLRKADIEKATFTVSGAQADEATTAKVRQFAATQLAPVLEREVCTTYTPKGDTLIANATMDGAPLPGEQVVIWVSPSDDYRVAP
jgi:hypothetical protein